MANHDVNLPVKFCDFQTASKKIRVMRKLFLFLQLLTITFPIGVFFAYIIMDEGDQFTFEHYLVTALSAFPFFMSLLIKFFLSDFEDK